MWGLSRNPIRVCSSTSPVQRRRAFHFTRQMKRRELTPRTLHDFKKRKAVKNETHNAGCETPVPHGRLSAVAVRSSRDLLAIAGWIVGPVGRTRARGACRANESVDGCNAHRAHRNRRVAEVKARGFCWRMQYGDFECCARHSQPKMRDRRRGRNDKVPAAVWSHVFWRAHPRRDPWRKLNPRSGPSARI